MNSKTLKYIIKRVLLAIVTVWVVITVTFFVMHAVPGGPFMGEKAISAAAQAALEAKYGLDKPLLEQYFTYLKDIVTKFDFGPSLKQRGRMVVDIISDGMKTSVKLGVVAACLAAVIGIPEKVPYSMLNVDVGAETVEDFETLWEEGLSYPEIGTLNLCLNGQPDCSGRDRSGYPWRSGHGGRPF